jgi:hypothetical protein
MLSGSQMVGLLERREQIFLEDQYGAECYLVGQT